jgi:hypothetical protein
MGINLVINFGEGNHYETNLSEVIVESFRLEQPSKQPF